MFDIGQRMIVLSIALVLDLIIGDPHGNWHPVVAIGRFISYMDKRTKKRTLLAGVWLAIAVIAVSVFLPVGILFFAYGLHPAAGIVVESIMCCWLLAMRSLYDESMKVYRALVKRDVKEARHAVSMIVGRDTKCLDDMGITRAAVETVAENTSDGVIAPLLFIALLGAPGGFFYKAINTMDSMIGYKNDKYRRLGTAAARLDDIVNIIPARASALMMLLASAILRMDVKNAWKIYKRDRRKHDSPNSAQTESVCAGALRVVLAGDAFYFGQKKEKPTIGDGLREIEYEDIRRANHLMLMTSFLFYSFSMSIFVLLLLL